jgi:hypothetical protein
MSVFTDREAVRADRHPRNPACDTVRLIGASFKHEHLTDILADDGFDDGFFEVHAENYMGAGAPPHRAIS